MSEQGLCSKCGASLRVGSPNGLCPKCLVGEAAARTATFRPAARPDANGPASGPTAVDLAEFRRSLVDLGLIGADELSRFIVALDEVPRLAGALIRAGRLTAYQAAALAQGKARGLAIGDYLVAERLGQGGMGVVFKAIHRPTGQVVALKMLPPSFGRDPDAVRRFRREVEIASRIDHPNVVAALDASEARGVHYLTMEYIGGYDLDRLVADGGPMPVDLALHCTIHAARGLAAAHAQGIIHRDVKPANIMLDDKSLVRVLDLGLARVVEAGNLIGGSPVGALTQSGAYMGTIDFMAPEQADDPRKVDHRADIYSLGCTLYFLLTGRPPFLGDTVLKRLMAHQERPAPSLCAARPEVPKHLEAAYLQMMAKQPSERPDSMGDVIDLLEACRLSPEDEEAARSGLTTFARRAFKRAAPRGRDRGPDASIFARRPANDAPQFDPDLRFEDVVMDLREERITGPLPEAKLPPTASRPLPKQVRRRRSRRRSAPYVGLGLALIALAGAWLALRPRPGPEIPAPASSALVAAVMTSTVGDRTPARADAAAPAFRPLFNGRDLDGWAGDLGDYQVRDGLLSCKPGRRAVIFDPVERTDFAVRVEFRQAPGSDAGLLIRYPGVVDINEISTRSMCEIQILDDTHPSYGNVDARYLTGSAWGIAAGRRGHLKPLGQWNAAEVTVRGSTVKVELNGAAILDADLAPIREFANGRDHVGKNRKAGFFALQGGAGTNQGNVEFRKVEIRDLNAPTTLASTAASAYRRLFNGIDMTGWSIEGENRGGWWIEDDVLVARGDDFRTRNYLITDRDYADFRLRFDFRLDRGAGAGIALRAIPGERVPQWDANPGFDHPLFKLTDGAPIQPIGTMHWVFDRMGVQPDTPADPRPAGEWNQAVIEVRGRTITAEVNGKTILSRKELPVGARFPDGTIPALDRPRGRIGLQKHTGTIRFRNIEIQELAGP